MRKRYLFCFIAILAVLPLTSIFQTAVQGEASFSSRVVAQTESFCKKNPESVKGLSSSLSTSHILAAQANDLSAREILELRKSCSGESILEYTLTLSADGVSFDVTPLCTVTPIQPNGNTIALVGYDPKSGNFMWFERYTGNFPSVTQSEALSVLVSQGYNVRGSEAKLVFFDYDNYWMFEVMGGQSLVNAFVMFSDMEVKLPAEMFARVMEYETKSSGGGWGSLPASQTFMEGKVPYFIQSEDACGLYALKQVFWWCGTRYNGRYVETSDIADYLGTNRWYGRWDKNKGPWYLWELESAFIHFMGKDEDTNLWCTYGSGNMAIVKDYVNSNIPCIWCIKAPGTTGVWCNHYVTVIGWDDSLGDGGAWLLHDTGGFFYGGGDGHSIGGGNGFDVWVSYSTLGDCWDYPWNPGDIRQTHGVVAASPGDGKIAFPTVGISDETHGKTVNEDIGGIMDIETLTLGVWLHTDGYDYASSEPQSQGAFVRLDGAQIVSVDVRDQTQWFKSYKTFDEQRNEVSCSGARIIEFYTDDFAYHGPPHTVGAYMTIKPTRAGGITVYYRGWLTDQDDVASEDTITIDDGRPGLLTTELYEPLIRRAPVDVYYNDREDASGRDDFLAYPTSSKTCMVQDDDTEGPTISNPSVNSDVYDYSSSDIRLGATISDSSGLSDVQFVYWYDVKGPTYEISGRLDRYVDMRRFPFYYGNIPRSEWINHVGSTVYYLISATDADYDWPPYYGWVYVGQGRIRWQLIKDNASTTSPDYLRVRILDDDVEGPSFSNPSSEYVETTEVYRIQIDATDPAGISAVRFKVKLGDSWSDWHAPSGSSGSTYWYEIPKEDCIPHAGETIYWAANAVDNDNDRPGDAASSQSTEYLATLPAGIPEYPLMAILPLSMIAALLAAIVLRKKRVNQRSL
jgi:hypothetical protein